MKLLWKSPHASIIRRGSLRNSLYQNSFWSANVAIFDPVKMPQRMEKTYSGNLKVVELDKDGVIEVVVPNSIHGSDGYVEVAGVMEALFFASRFPDEIGRLKGILAPGSIGSPNNRDFFCPYAFQFGSVVSMGIELVKRDQNQLVIIPAGSKILAIDGFERWH